MSQYQDGRMTWMDATIYGRDERERIPRVWYSSIGVFTLTVHRIHMLTGWYLSIPGVAHHKSLGCMDADAAKLYALAFFETLLDEALDITRTVD